MSGFNAVVLLAARPDGKTFEMWDERVYTGSEGDSWTIPAGFKTDFATIPACVSWAIPKLGAYSLAAIVHDLLCVGLNDWHEALKSLADEGGYFTTDSAGAKGIVANGRFVPVPTADAVDTDAIFRKIVKEHGVDRVTATLLWVGVRWGALGNASRREGWLKTAPAVLGWSLLFAPVLVPATVLAVVGGGILRVVRRIFR